MPLCNSLRDDLRPLPLPRVVQPPHWSTRPQTLLPGRHAVRLEWTSVGRCEHPVCQSIPFSDFKGDCKLETPRSLWITNKNVITSVRDGAPVEMRVPLRARA